MTNTYATRAQRVEPPDALDFFPTPPWATRALIEEVVDPSAVKGLTCWEPAAGEGHMAEVLREYFAHVHASDVHDYGRGYTVGTFTGLADLGLDRAATPSPRPDSIITNPPFNAAIDFLWRAFQDTGHGVAFLLRTAWIEGEDRWRRTFSSTAPAHVAQFAERVAMVKGRWDPDAPTATSYMWLIWERDPRDAFARPGESQLVWIAPGAKQRHTRPDDRARFAGTTAAHGAFGAPRP